MEKTKIALQKQNKEAGDGVEETAKMIVFMFL